MKAFCLVLILFIHSMSYAQSDLPIDIEEKIDESEFLKPIITLDLNAIDDGFDYGRQDYVLEINSSKKVLFVKNINIETGEGEKSKKFAPPQDFDGIVTLVKDVDVKITDSFRIRVKIGKEVKRRLILSFNLPTPTIVDVKFENEPLANSLRITYQTPLSKDVIIDGTNFYNKPDVKFWGKPVNVAWDKSTPTKINGKITLNVTSISDLFLGDHDIEVSRASEVLARKKIDVYSDSPNFTSVYDIKYDNGTNDAKFYFEASNVSPLAKLYTSCPDNIQNCGIKNNQFGHSIIKEKSKYHSYLTLKIPDDSRPYVFKVRIVNGDGRTSEWRDVTISKIKKSAVLKPFDEKRPFISGVKAKFSLATSAKKFSLIDLSKYDLTINNKDTPIEVSPNSSDTLLTGSLSMPIDIPSTSYFKLTYKNGNDIDEWSGKVTDIGSIPELKEIPIVTRGKEIKLLYGKPDDDNWRIEISSSEVDITDSNISDDGVVKFTVGKNFQKDSIGIEKYYGQTQTTKDYIFVESIDVPVDSLILFNKPLKRKKNQKPYFVLDDSETSINLKPKDKWVDSNREFMLGVRTTDESKTEIHNREMSFRVKDSVTMQLSNKIPDGEIFDINFSSLDNKIDQTVRGYKKTFQLKPYLGLSGIRTLYDDPKNDSIPRSTLLSGLNVGLFSSTYIGYPNKKKHIGIGVFVSAYEATDDDINLNLGAGLLVLETFFFGIDLFENNRSYTIGLTTDIAGIIEKISN